MARAADRPATDHRVLSIGIGLVLCVCAIQSVVHLIDTLVLSHSIDALNLNQNDGVFDWVSQLTILAALVGVIALAVACKARRGMLGLLAALLAFLFVEDLLQLHDRLGLGSDWQLVYLPVLAPTFALLWAVGEWAQGAAGRSMRV